MRHYEKTIKNRTKTISEIQTDTITILNNPSLNERQTKALMGTYEQMLKSSTEEAKRIKEERATASERKPRAPPTKRQRTKGMT